MKHLSNKNVWWCCQNKNQAGKVCPPHHFSWNLVELASIDVTLKTLSLTHVKVCFQYLYTSDCKIWIGLFQNILEGLLANLVKVTPFNISKIFTLLTYLRLQFETHLLVFKAYCYYKCSIIACTPFGGNWNFWLANYYST